ncbi:MAG: hypothetical protein FLDDKLPJ_01530 [Phycisphaerae bacterium]|nr:hypothetical protein [Phycisphaerae bacterium]
MTGHETTTTCCRCRCGSGAPTSATRILMDEHRVIERVLDALEEKLRREPRVCRRFVTDAIDFFRNFADGCHHHKEEDELFPVLESAGIPRVGGPIGCMLHEHDEGRRLIRRMEEHLDAASQGEPRADAVVRSAAADYAHMLRFHIQKEDTILFRMADQVLGEEEQRLMLEAFDRAEHHNGDAGKHERYLKLAEKLHQEAFGA